MSDIVSDTRFNIIIADDHPVFRKGVASTLRNMPFINNIAEAADGNEVLALLKKQDYSLVLLDINMKGMDGKTTAVHLHRDYPGVKIIAISMIDDIQVIRQMYQAGCHGYLVKNADETEIIKAIKTVMAHKKYFTPDVFEKLLGPDEDNFEIQALEHLLTGTDIKLIQLICEGKSNKEIAEELDYALRTVENYRARLYEKINVENTVDLMRFALRNNIIKS